MPKDKGLEEYARTGSISRKLTDEQIQDMVKAMKPEPKKRKKRKMRPAEAIQGGLDAR